MGLNIIFQREEVGRFVVEVRAIYHFDRNETVIYTRAINNKKWKRMGGGSWDSMIVPGKKW